MQYDPLATSSKKKVDDRQADRIRGSINVPLSDEGVQQANQLGKRFAKAGGLDFLASSNFDRTNDTAKIIANHSPYTPQPTPTNAAHPWYTGQYDGTPSDGAYNSLNQYIKSAPNVPVPGRAPGSTQPGESFNSFKDRWLGFMKNLMDIQENNPDSKVGVTTHYINQKLNDSWFAAGAKGNGNIDLNEMTKYLGNDKPGDIQRVYQQGTKWKLEHLDDNSSLDKPGIYVIRHGKTDMNG